MKLRALLVLAATALVAVVSHGAGLGDEGLFLHDMQARTDSMRASNGVTTIPVSVTITSPSSDPQAVSGTPTTVSGTTTGTIASVTWSTTPASASGSCSTGAGTFSCSVDFTNACDSGSQTVTVTANGSATDTTGLTFPSAPPSSNRVVWLDGRDIDGSSNATLTSYSSTIQTWTNKGSSADNFTQATAAARPTFVSPCGNTRSGCARFDGGDFLQASTAANFTYLNTGADWTTYIVWQAEALDPNALYVIASTQSTALGNTARGVTLWYDDRTGSSRFDRSAFFLSNGTASQMNSTGIDGQLPQRKWHNWVNALVDDNGAGNDVFIYVDGTQVGTVARGGTYSSSAASAAMTLGAAAGGSSFFKGDVAQVLSYSAAHNSTVRGQIGDWVNCTYGTMPFIADSAGLACQAQVTPIAKLCESVPCRIGVVGDSLSAIAGSSGVTSWATTLATNLGANYTVTNVATSGQTLQTAKSSQWRNQLRNRDFDVLIMLIGTNDLPTRSAAAITPDFTEVINEALYECQSVLTISVLPRGTSSGWTGAMQTEEDTLNTNLAAAATGRRMHLDLYSTFEDGGTPDKLKTTFDFGDGLHINNAGELAIEAAVRPLVGP